MSVQPPWPDRPGSDSEANHAQGKAPQHDGWTQPGQYQGQSQQQPPSGQQPPYAQQQQGQPYPQQPQQYGQRTGQYAPQQPPYAQQPQSQPQYGQQQYGQQSPAAPYGSQQFNAQPYYGVPNGTPGGMTPAPKKKRLLPWILAGGGLVITAVIVTVVLLVSGLFAGGNKANMVAAPTTSASFQYPEGWIRTGENITIFNEDGSQPAEHFRAVNRSDSASSMMVYEAGDRPAGAVTTEKIHAAIDQGLAAQLAASQEDLVYFRSTSAFGCLKDFAYTDKPVIVERDGLYGYSYGYTCLSNQGKITGKYLVAYDTVGVSHRMTVEAVDAEWASNKATLTAIVDSLKPAV